MSIRLPNRFSCRSRTAVFQSSDPVDFRPLAQEGLAAGLLAQLSSTRFLITISTVTSTSSGDREFSFRETLVKVPVTVDRDRYLFPVIGYVDHEYSLIRGYLLGFKKVFHRFGPEPMTFTSPDFGLDFGIALDPDGTDDLPPEQDLPLLLWADYQVAQAEGRGYGQLVVEGYERTNVSSASRAVPEQKVTTQGLVPTNLYEVRDTFVVTGVSTVGQAVQLS